MADRKILILLILTGAALRWVNLPESMSFFYDQARDALVARGILQGHLVLVGPSADTSGLFMGPLWYYFLTPLYFIAQGNPATVLWLTSFFDLATVVLLYKIGVNLFSRKTGLIAAAFWAFGALPVAYARTLSNPSTSAFWSLVLFFALTKIARGKNHGLPLVALSLAILFQFNLATAYLLIPYVFLALILIKSKLNNHRMILVSLAIFVVSFLPQIFFEIRNHFPSLVHLQTLFFSSQPKEGFLHGLWLKGENFNDELSNYTFYRWRDLSIMAFFASVVVYLRTKSRDKTLFLSWLILPLLTYFFLYFRGEAHPHYLLGWIPVVVLLLAHLVSLLGLRLWPVAIGIFLLFVSTCLPGLYQEIFLKEHLAQPADPNPIGLSDQMQVVDYLYQSAAGQPFGYHNYGIVPYFEDKEWQYLFLWYGQRHYGYLPSRRAGNPLYLIYEPDPYLPEFEKHWLKDFRSLDKGPVVARINIAAYTIEKFDKRLIKSQ